MAKACFVRNFHICIVCVKVGGIGNNAQLASLRFAPFNDSIEMY